MPGIGGEGRKDREVAGRAERGSSFDCLTETEFDEFVLRRLSGETLERVEEHLLVCGKCLDRVESEETFVASFREAAKQLQTEEMKGVTATRRGAGRLAWLQQPWGWMGGAAAAAAVVLLMVTVWLPSRQTTLSETEVALRVERGAGLAKAPAAPAGTPLRLSIDLTELPALERYTVEIVDQAGRPVREATLAASDGRLLWASGMRLKQGAYWVRLYDGGPSRELLREFALAAQ